MDGRSLVGAFTKPERSIRKDFLIEYYSDREFPRTQGMGYKAIRTDRYKYIRYAELSGMDELYDLQRDPHELNNLLPDQAPRNILGDLRRRLDRLVDPDDNLTIK